MQLEQYFDFVASDAIRIAGTRVGIETVVGDYLEGASPEEIVIRYPTLSLEQVHATITYYLAHRETVESYVARVREQQNEVWEAQQHTPSALVISLRERLSQLESARSVREEALEPASASGAQ
jgi:uncharacterized protein (DUF433 family)